MRRDGKHFLMPAELMVPGDIVSLESGDKVPADLRLLQVKNFLAAAPDDNITVETIDLHGKEKINENMRL